MANNVIDAAIRLRDLFTPTVRSVNASLETMKTQMAAAKQSVSGLSDKLTEHERIQKRTAKSIEQAGSKISGLSDKMAQSAGMTWGAYEKMLTRRSRCRLP